MATDNETVAEITEEMLEKARDKRTDNGAWLRAESVGLMLEEYANAVNSAHKRELAAKDAEIAELQRRLKVAENALAELQARCVASVHDGTIDPYEALKIAEDALATIRGDGGAK